MSYVRTFARPKASHAILGELVRMNVRSELPVEQDPLVAPLSPGDVVAGKYRIDETAGTGGMAIVYAAQHLMLDQRVAVKVLVAGGARDAVNTERFVREAQAAARLQSEHAARVVDAGVLATGHPYLVMEYLEGCDLAELLELSGPIEVPELVDYMLQALEGIAHAHAAQIVHRDIKPSNLFITVRPDGSNTVKVLDFGISKSTVEHVNPQVTKLTGNAVLGSPAYMSPEQVRNASRVDGRTDVWSLGVSMYELLTGRMPFSGDGVGAILAAILEADAVPVHTLRPQVPRGLSDAIARCLRRSRDDRWADVGELARALAPFGTGDWASYPERIAATLVNARQLRPPTPLGAFAVPSLTASVSSGDMDPLAATQPPSSARKVFIVDNPEDVHSPALATLTAGDPSVITQRVERRARRSRWVLLLVALPVSGGVAAFVVTHRRAAAVSLPATASSPAAPSAAPSPAPSAAPVAVSTAPTASISPVAALPAPSSTAAASAHRSPHRGQVPPAPTETSRPAILRSRN
jgi:serine/threonine protein kinase